MERTDETLSTRDLAGSAQEPAAEDAPPQNDARFEREDGGESAPAPLESAEPGESAAPAAEPVADDLAATPPAGKAQPAADDHVATAEAAAPVDEAGALLPEGEEDDFRRRWEEIQTRFVDDPRQAVEDADSLVAGVMKRIAEGFAQARDGLEGQWTAGGDVGTEELRVALQRYRSFFRRLLSA
jgi:hypothetical protein